MSLGSKIKVGDRVKSLVDDDNVLTKDKTYRVIPHFFSSERNVCIVGDDGSKWVITVKHFIKMGFRSKRLSFKEWSKKCSEEGVHTTVVMILPPRTDTEYWHKYIMKADEIRLCKGRVNFLQNGVVVKAEVDACIPTRSDYNFFTLMFTTTI